MAIIVEIVAIFYRGDRLVLHVYREYWNSILLIAVALAALACSPVFGYLLDISGTRQRLYLFGLSLLFTSMAIFTAAQSITWYIFARTLQGAATAMVTVAGLAIVTDAVDKRHLGQMIGYVGTALTLGFMCGPLLGGVIYNFGGFYAVFGMVFGIIALDMLLRLAVIEKKTAARWLSLPHGETGFNERGNDMERLPYGTGLSGTGIVKPFKSGSSFALFKLLRQPRILISLWAVIVSNLVVSVFDAGPASSSYRERQRPSSSRYLADRLGSRMIAFASFAILSPTLFCLRFVQDNTFTDKAILCAILGITGMCVDLSEPALLVEIQKVLDDMETQNPGVFGENGAVAQAFSLQSMAHFGGLALGPIAGGFVSFNFGWNVMTLGLGMLSLFTAIPMLWLSGRVDESENEVGEERQPLLR
ncbi:hypothetical protein N7492_000158 [Penicillium capsulatum]|uniref:Major facilitator superfamily (MFS) profile domain-containing protein n=1 Tax=Penicillium capsulatum TaxID=69766 RepID=A0A9W9LZR1_9EURO|nr:hypothetical protein N7492_000158 [Penicillium capsulatum]